MHYISRAVHNHTIRFYASALQDNYLLLGLSCVPAGYSVWTNTSYKMPLLASAVACLLGNLTYVLSYDAKAVWLLFVARLITGFGALSRLPGLFCMILVSQ